MMPTSARISSAGLAIDGGTPVRSSPLPPWPQYAQDEIDAVRATLSSGKVNYWTGEEGVRFEEEFAAWLGCRHAVALANGSVALELALRALGIGAGDDVVVTSRSFMASASCAVLVGARPVFADVDPVSQNLSADTVRAALTPATRAIVVVHLGGWPCDMVPLIDLARSRNIVVIEDCAQSLGATYRGRATGTLAHAAAFSFCQDKIMSTGGEGGMLVTNDRSVWERCWSYKDHGKSYAAVFERSHPQGFHWLHESFGTNWRMTELQAAIGRRQLKKLPQWLELRRRNAALMSATLKEVPGLTLPALSAEPGHAYYRYPAVLDRQRLKPGWSHPRVIDAINAEGIPCTVGGCSEIYLEKAFAGGASAPAQRFPHARSLGEASLAFLVHPTLTERDIRDTCEAVAKVMGAAAGR